MTGPSQRVPTLTVGLPVFNGERYLSESLDALLAQTYSDFELIISDNASTDTTPEICRTYAERDERIRVIRQPQNIGAGPNHNFLPLQARGKYFKWVSHDDLYHPQLLQRCVEVLDTHPEYVLAHAWDALVDDHGAVIEVTPYTMLTDSPSPRVRLRSLLYGVGGNDFYGVIRTDVLRYVRPHGSYFNADRTFTASLALHGRFYQVPEVLTSAASIRVAPPGPGANEHALQSSTRSEPIACVTRCSACTSSTSSATWWPFGGHRCRSLTKLVASSRSPRGPWTT